jgi:hypothetical protein
MERIAPSSIARDTELRRARHEPEPAHATPPASAEGAGALQQSHAVVAAASTTNELRGEAGRDLLGRAPPASSAPPLPEAPVGTPESVYAAAQAPVAAHAPEVGADLVAGPAGTATPKPSPNHVAGFFGGVWGGVADTARGLLDLGDGAVSLSGLRGQHAQREAAATLRLTTEAVVRDPRRALGAVVRPITEPWRKGNYGEAIGRGTFEAASLVVGTKGLNRLAGGARLGEAGTAAARVERAADAAADVGRAQRATAAPARPAMGLRAPPAATRAPVTSADVARPGMAATKMHFVAQELHAEIAGGQFRVMAGHGAPSGAAIRDAARLAAQHGGDPNDWQKVSSTARKVAGDGTILPTPGQVKGATTPSPIARQATVDPLALEGTAHTSFEVHAYRNARTGQIVEPKLAAEVRTLKPAEELAAADAAHAAAVASGTKPPSFDRFQTARVNHHDLDFTSP